MTTPSGSDTELQEELQRLDPQLREAIHAEVVLPEVVRTVTAAQAFEIFWQQHGVAGAAPSGRKLRASRLWPVLGRQPLGGTFFSKQSLRSLTISASIAILGAVGAVFFFFRQPPATAKIYQTSRGQRLTVRLTNGSTIRLAPATLVTLTSRGFEVNGEAYFAVVPHPSQPFIVVTRNARIQVLGTRFVVRQYPEELGSRVAVEEGRVALQMVSTQQPAGSFTVMSERAMALVTDSGVTVRNSVLLNEFTGWTHGVLVFNQVTLNEVIADVGRAYGADIRVSDPRLAKRKLQLDISVAEDPLSVVLNLICEATDAHITHDRHGYILSPGRAATAQPRHELQHQYLQPERTYGK